jgi:hypothetical protein
MVGWRQAMTLADIAAGRIAVMRNTDLALS